MGLTGRLPEARKEGSIPFGSNDRRENDDEVVLLLIAVVIILAIGLLLRFG
jgi:hypothetical protein